MSDSDIERIEIYRLRPGSPPEHLRQLLMSVESPSEIEKIMQEVEVSQKMGQQSHPTLEGGSIRELIIKHKDGRTKRILLKREQ